MRGGSAVEHGVLHQIGQDLHDEDGVHGDQEQLVRHVDLHGHGGKPFSEFADRLVQDFLRSLRLLGDFGRFVADPGDGEQIFHHADEPLGVIPHIHQKGLLFGRGEGGIFQNGGGGTHDRGQRGANVVGDGAEQIRPHLHLFVFHPEAVLLLGLGGQGAGDQRDHQKGEHCQRIAGNGEVKRHIGICKHIVDADDTQHRRNQPEEISAGEAGDQEHGQHIDRRGKAVDGVRRLVQKGAGPRGA